jgi:hypothetical protein
VRVAIEREGIRLNKVVIEFEDDEIGRLYELLDRNKESYPELHEKVYQAMTTTLLKRISAGW